MRRRLGPPSLLAGVAGSLLLALGTYLLRDMPAAGASDLDVYTYFLDHRDAVRAGAAAGIFGFALLTPFLTSIRSGDAAGPRRPAALTALICGAIAVAAGVAAAAIVGGLAAGAENADPASSRTLLDVAGGLTAAAGALLALAILSAAGDVHEAGAPAWLPALWTLCAIGCLLGLGPLVSDASLLAWGSALGTFAGVAGLLVWTASATLLAHHHAKSPPPVPGPQYVSSTS